MFDLISWRIHEFYKSKVSAAVTVRPVQEIKNDPQVSSKLRNFKKASGFFTVSLLFLTLSL